MPLPALLAVTALAGAAVLSGRTQAGSRASMTPAQAAAHKARLVELLRAGRWRDALELNKAEGKRKLDLRGANLSDANLSDANLIGTNLTDAELLRASLYGADLTGANLTRALLLRAKLINTNLTNANLADTNLEYANLTDANLTNANLTGATLEGARLPEGLLSPNTRLDAVPWAGTPFGWKAIASPRGARFLPLSKA